MKDEKIIDAYDTIAPGEHSRERVKKNILERADCPPEERSRKISWLPKTAVAALAIVFVLMGGVTAYAMWRYLSPAQVAEQMEDAKLADAFESDKAVLTEGEKQQFGEYSVSLLGLVSGEDLSVYEVETNGEIQKDRTYCVVAIEKADGSAMTDDDLDHNFLVSPFIQGKDPRKVNIFYMGGGAISDVKDGVFYRIMDCDNLSAFADRTVYLSVSDAAMLPKTKVLRQTEDGQEVNVGEDVLYIYDKATGEIKRNANYKGLNALFTLPLDRNLADSQRAEKLLKKWKKQTEEETEEDYDPVDDKIVKYMHGITVENDVENIKSEFTLIENCVLTKKPDKDGALHFTWDSKELGTGCETNKEMENLFWDDPEPGTIVWDGCYGGGEDIMTTELYQLNEDGSVTMFPYYKKISEITESASGQKWIEKAEQLFSDLEKKQ